MNQIWILPHWENSKLLHTSHALMVLGALLPLSVLSWVGVLRFGRVPEKAFLLLDALHDLYVVFLDEVYCCAAWLSGRGCGGRITPYSKTG
ncbi:hypothetical protein [Vibrio sp. Of7-15]|uniref:hypothetical protein n=1 Tax=Vibrio sp. Of7-15 TaxID=2724879 RepID=UPI001EF1AF3B|nr:hypothetical protein [Vibrio sp. Of7-15]